MLTTKIDRLPTKYPKKHIVKIHEKYAELHSYGPLDPTKGKGHYNDAGETKECAYVTLMMIGDSYLPGALVLAKSLRDTGTKYPIVIMVTPDVSDDARRVLATSYDEVVSINYLRYTCVRLDGALHKRYGNWNEYGFTKFNMMALTKFKKVLYLETDEHVLFNLDHLFEMPTPVGLFSSPWGYPMKYRVMNPYLGLRCGEYVQPWMIDEAFKNYGHGSIGSLVLLRPDANLFVRFQSEISKNIPFGFPKAQSTIEEVVFPWFYSMVMKYPMYQSHLKYGWVPWKKPRIDDRDFDKVYVNHFFGTDKPWKENQSKYHDDYWNFWWSEFSTIYLKCDSEDQLVLTKCCRFMTKPKNKVKSESKDKPASKDEVDDLAKELDKQSLFTK